MIRFEQILTTAKAAIEANDALDLVPCVIDLGYSDSAIEAHLQNSGLCIALQPIFGWTPNVQEVNEIRGEALHSTVDLSARLWINPTSLETEEDTVGDKTVTTTTGNIVLSDGSELALYYLVILIVSTIAQAGSGTETAREFVPSGGLLTGLDSGAMCYDLSFNVRAEMLY